MKLLRSWGNRQADDDLTVRLEILNHIRQILADGQPRMSRQITVGLANRGVVVDKSLVNSVLHREGRTHFYYDNASHMHWMDIESNAQADAGEPIVDASRPKLIDTDVDNRHEAANEKPQVRQLPQQYDLEQHIINALQELRSATVAELVDALAVQGIRSTGLTIYEHLKILRGKKVVIEPHEHPDSTTRQPIFIYELAAKPAAEEHENVELQLPHLESDLSECIMRILENSEMITSRDLVDELARIYDHRIDPTQINQALRGLHKAGFLARPEPHASSTPQHPVLMFRLKKMDGQDPRTKEKPAVTPDQIRETILEFLGQRETATIGELQGALTRRLGVAVHHRDIYEQLQTLRQQHILAEPEEPPAHTTLAPVYVYHLRKRDQNHEPHATSTQTNVQPSLQELPGEKETGHESSPHDELEMGEYLQPQLLQKADGQPISNRHSSLGAQSDSEDNLHAITIDCGIHYVFSSAEIDDHSFFAIKNEGNVANIIINSNHPIYARVMDLIEPSSNGKSVTPQGQKPFDAGETMKLLLIAWAEFEENQPSRRVRERTEDARSGWGRRLKDVLRRNGNQ